MDTVAVNDNALDKEKPDHLAHLRKAVGAATVEEVREIVRQEIANDNTIVKIELKIGDVIKELPEQPRHKLFAEILTSVNCAIPTALIGPAGSGKSTVCEQIAEALTLPYYLQNAVTGTHELAGYLDAHGTYHSTTFRIAYEDGGLLLVDEVDTSDAGALKWMNTALANGHAMFPDSGKPIRRHPNFRIVIAANTFGNGADRVYVGANQLDASTLDRFVFFDFGYDEALESILSGNPAWAERVQTIRKAAMTEKARVVVSPRASIYGSKLLVAGWSKDVVEERTIWKGMDPELKARILSRIETEKTVGQMKAQGWSADLIEKFGKEKVKTKKAA
jgi:cobaltochelatase CobS